MPNGFYGSKEEWERLVAPLRQLDSSLSSFAAAHNLDVAHNYHNLPNRMVKWSRAGIQRVIQISLYDNDKILFGLSAYKDEAGRRFGKRWPATMDIPLQEFKTNLDTMLTEAYQRLEAVSEADLEYWIQVETFDQ
jgi:hypothetical protein